MAKLVYNYGAMNSAKSARLIMDAYQLRADGKNVLIFKPALDDRDNGIVRSRAVPTALEATIIGADEEGTMFSYTTAEHPRVVLADEVQFFTPEQIDELVAIVDVLGITVITYGLLTDFRGELFAGSKRLIEAGAILERVRSECTVCNEDGTFNARYVNGIITLQGEQIVTGAEETYRVLCRKCYNEQLHGI